jgi:type IV secretory pathway TrbD component
MTNVERWKVILLGLVAAVLALALFANLARDDPKSWSSTEHVTN